MAKIIKIALLVVVALLVVIQFRRPVHANPSSDPAASFATVANPAPQALAIVERSCRDCHSNQTAWPWYSQVAPASWLVAADVETGRRHLNFSEWGKLSPERRLMALGSVCRAVTAGEMPLPQYTLIHGAAKLSQADIATLCMMSVAH